VSKKQKRRPPKITFTKGPFGKVLPATSHDADLWAHVREGDQFTVIVQKDRDLVFHKSSRAAMQFGQENWPGGHITKGQYDRWLKVSTGLCHIEADLVTGEPVIETDSTAFDWMGDLEYKAWFKDLAFPKIAAGLNLTVEELKEALDECKQWGKCANPTCRNRACDSHHIFGGDVGRQRSDVLGLVVKICRTCHLASEGSDRVTWERLWCGVLGVDRDEMSIKVFGGVKKYKLNREVSA
jgi:hypothetical protein